MSWEGGVVFIACAVVAVLSAVATIGLKSPLRCMSRRAAMWSGKSGCPLTKSGFDLSRAFAFASDWVFQLGRTPSGGASAR